MAAITQTVRTVRGNRVLSVDTIEFDTNEALEGVRRSIISSTDAALGEGAAETDGSVTVITRDMTVTILKFDFDN